MRIHDASLATQVYEIIHRQITRGGLRPGERIRESEYTRQLGISRTPVREALLKLQMEGLVVCNTRRSYHVRRLTVHDVKGIYWTLSILESAGVGLAAPLITPGDISLLKEYNRNMENAAQRGDMEAFGRANRKFHDVFLAKLDNEFLSKVSDSVRALLYTVPIRRNSLSEWLTKSVREHSDIIRLAEAGDSRALEYYFRDVHWSSEKNFRYIVDAFDLDGDAVLPI